MIVINMSCSNDDQELYWRLRSSGTDASGNDYNFQILQVFGTTAAASRSTSQNFARIGNIDDTSQSGYVFNIYRPFSATPTVALALGGIAHDPVRIINQASTHTLSTSYDGITFYPSGGTMTGTIRIYGIANS